MNRIKSLHIDTEMTWRGGEQQVRYLIRALKELGSEPVVVCKAGSAFADMLSGGDIRYHELPLRGGFDIPSALSIAKIVNNENIGIVHAHTSHAHSLAAIASKFFRTGAKLIVSRRVDFPLKGGFLNRLKYGIPDRYIAVSRAIKGVMVDCGVPAFKISVVHSGVDPNKFNDASNEPLMKEFGLTRGEKIIGNIAHLADHKGQKYLISAFSLIKKERDDVRLFIVGHGELEDTLKQQVDELGLKDSVIFTGFRKDVGNFYKLFDVFVMSSHLEGLCTSLLDAMIARTPVVATNAGGMPEIVKDKVTGRLAENKDPASIKEAIIDVLSDTDAAGRYVANGYELVREEFDYHITAKRTFEIYKELLY